jgi:hypothetical protein
MYIVKSAMTHDLDCFDSHTHPTPGMQWAAKYGYVTVLQFVKRWGLSSDVIKPTALYRAACYARINILEFVMAWKRATREANKPADQVTVKDFLQFWEGLSYAPPLLGMCANHILDGAATYGQISVLEWLKYWGLSADNVRRKHNAALRWAAEQGRVNALQYLKDNWGLTTKDARSLDNYALVGAAQHGHVDVLTFLKDVWGLNTSDARAQDGAPLRLAIKFGGVAVLQVLKEQYGLTCADLRAHDNNALRLAVVYDRVPVLHFLKNWRDSPSGTAYGPGCLTLEDVRTQGNYVLRVAIRYDQVAVLQFFREWRDSDNSRLTLQDLHVAIERNQPRVFQDATKQVLDAWLAELLAQND